MGYFQVRYDSRVIIYKRKMFIRLATDLLFDSFGLNQTSKDDAKINISKSAESKQNKQEVSLIPTDNSP